MRRGERLANVIVLCAVSRLALGTWFGGTPPVDLGVIDGRLKACPDRPNCIASYADGVNHVEPLTYHGDAGAALRRLESVLSGMPRVRVVAKSSTYLRAEARSRWFGFVDDLEFLLKAEAHCLHVRSASRLGYSDFGVNRKRLEAIRAAFGASPTH
jgi:uncharacterized protein (DUF1499 family)